MYQLCSVVFFRIRPPGCSKAFEHRGDASLRKEAASSGEVLLSYYPEARTRKGKQEAKERSAQSSKQRRRVDFSSEAGSLNLSDGSERDGSMSLLLHALVIWRRRGRGVWERVEATTSWRG